MMSPKKKKAKYNHNSEIQKEASGSSEQRKLVESPRKRIKLNNKDEETKLRKRKNFITACEQVSCRNYFDHRTRLLLVCLPSCVTANCRHYSTSGVDLKQMSLCARESFETEMKSNMWYEALEVCQMSITTRQYLSSDVLKDLVEIMLNAHEDEYAEYTAKYLMEGCQQVLMQHFNIHPPCFVKSLRNCYKNFLMSPMALKEDTFTDRNQYECNKGIVKYCFNRLEYELSTDSEDGPLIDKDKNVPEEMKHSVRGLHWQKEKCEIFELLIRSERMDRLFAVLETVIELLQFDLAIWHSRYINDLGCHIMRSHKPLMAYLLWSENVLYTGAVTNICRQIIRIFAKIIHLKYPNTKIKILTIWLNTMVQTFYICETNSNMDYPNTSKYCMAFAKDFYKIISDLPHESIIQILERIEPSFMRHLIGLLHLNKVLVTKESCIISMFINFIRDKKWKSYQCDGGHIIISSKLFPQPKNVKKKINYLMKKRLIEKYFEEIKEHLYEKMEESTHSTPNISRNQIVQSLYITLEAYLDAFDLQSVQDTWSELNEQLLNEDLIENESIPYTKRCYSVTESLIKTYRNMLQSIRELVQLLVDLKDKGELPDSFNIFGNIGLLEL